jgi:hypothetical protein
LVNFCTQVVHVKLVPAGAVSIIHSLPHWLY